MQYLGGKSKIRKEVSVFLESVRKPNQVYFEPFVGGGWILQEMTGERVASDGNKSLICMYQALQDGWTPPDFVSEDTYKQVVKDAYNNEPITAFIGFGCSFAGKWNGGYARSTDKVCYAATSKRSLMKQLPSIQNVKFVQGLYNDHTPKDMLVYCDPPYVNTTKYDALGDFNHNVFWEQMRKWVKNGNTVVVSEYTAPNDFVCVRTMKSRMGLSTGKAAARVVRDDKLFIHESQVDVIE